MISAIVVNNLSDDKPTEITVTAKAGVVTVKNADGSTSSTEQANKKSSADLNKMSAGISSGAPLKVTLGMNSSTGFVDTVTIEKR